MIFPIDLEQVGQTDVAIASNGFGDHLVLLPDPNQPKVLLATVFMWSHESGELDKVANDFAELGS